jgi:hypothetical protein
MPYSQLSEENAPWRQKPTHLNGFQGVLDEDLG